MISQSMIKDLFASTVQEMLEAEMDTHLGYAKHDTKHKQTDNSRNGHSRQRTVQSELGEIAEALPRDRQSEFDPVLVKKHQKRMPSIEDQVIALYARGVTSATSSQQSSQRVTQTLSLRKNKVENSPRTHANATHLSGIMWVKHSLGSGGCSR
jgi:transposase-like protein